MKEAKKSREAMMTELRSAYERGASIRTLVATTGKSYGSVHSMLLKSGTVLRGRGGPNHRTRVPR
ncbi:MAG: helix-turn-helix domain-containing protein [Mycobacterium sp.]